MVDTSFIVERSQFTDAQLNELKKDAKDVAVSALAFIQEWMMARGGMNENDMRAFIAQFELKQEGVKAANDQKGLLQVQLALLDADKKLSASDDAIKSVIDFYNTHIVPGSTLSLIAKDAELGLAELTQIDSEIGVHLSTVSSVAQQDIVKLSSLRADLETYWQFVGNLIKALNDLNMSALRNL